MKCLTYLHFELNKVFETGDEKFIENITEDSTVAETGNNGKKSPQVQNTSLVTDIYQINVDGQYIVLPNSLSN